MKNDLISVAETILSKRYRSIHRAFHEGHIENAGAFQHIPPIGRSGWILKLTSKFKKNYYIAIATGDLRYYVYPLGEIPWQYWEGDKSDNKLYQGDNPILYKELRDAETKRLNKDEGHTCPDS